MMLKKNILYIFSLSFPVMEGDLETIMAGLNCGTPSGIGWPILKDAAIAFLSCEDEVTISGMRSYYNPVEGNTYWLFNLYSLKSSHSSALFVKEIQELYLENLEPSVLEHLSIFVKMTRRFGYSWALTKVPEFCLSRLKEIQIRKVLNEFVAKFIIKKSLKH